MCYIAKWLLRVRAISHGRNTGTGGRSIPRFQLFTPSSYPNQAKSRIIRPNRHEFDASTSPLNTSFHAPGSTPCRFGTPIRRSSREQSASGTCGTASFSSSAVGSGHWPFCPPRILLHSACQISPFAFSPASHEPHHGTKKAERPPMVQIGFGQCRHLVRVFFGGWLGSLVMIYPVATKDIGRKLGEISWCSQS